MGLIYNWKENIGNVKKTGIPASRLAMALGISKWGSPLDLWLERKGLLEDDFKDTINMQWGRALEDDIIERYQSLHPEYVVEKYTGKLLSDEASKIHGYPDALIYENGKLIGVLECKTGSIHQRKFWDTDIPIDYEAQGHGYLILVPEAMFCDFAFFYSTGDDIIEKRLNRDDTILAEISKRAAAFWELVLSDKMPAERPEDGEIISQMHTPGEEYGELDFNGESLVLEYADITEKIKRLEEQKRAVEIELMNLVGDNAGLKNENHVVRWKITRRIDEKAVAEKYPQEYNASMQEKFSATNFKKYFPEKYNDESLKKVGKSIEIREVKND